MLLLYTHDYATISACVERYGSQGTIWDSDDWVRPCLSNRRQRRKLRIHWRVGDAIHSILEARLRKLAKTVGSLRRSVYIAILTTSPSYNPTVVTY